MRKIALLAVCVAAFLSGYSQQIPNGSFENWTNVFTPAGWTGAEDLAGIIIPLDTSIFTFKDTTTFTEGSASLKLVTDTINGPYSATVGIQPGVISLGFGQLNPSTFNPEFYGIPFPFRPDTFEFDYKMTSPGTDTGFAYMSLTNQGNNVVNFGAYLFADSSWTHVALPLTPFYQYGNGTYPDTLLIQFVASQGQNPIIGTTLHIDGVRFGYVNPPLSVSASGATTFCSGDSVTLHAITTSSNYTYQWNLGGVPITGATGSSYTAKNAGAYTVAIDSSSVTDTSLVIVVTDTNCTSGIANIAVASLNVYPNPTSSLLNINANQTLAGFGLQVYDVLGRLVLSQTLEGSNNVIDVAKLVDGTYIYRIADKQNGIIGQNKFNVLK